MYTCSPCTWTIAILVHFCTLCCVLLRLLLQQQLLLVLVLPPLLLQRAAAPRVYLVGRFFLSVAVLVFPRVLAASTQAPAALDRTPLQAQGAFSCVRLQMQLMLQLVGILMPRVPGLVLSVRVLRRALLLRGHPVRCVLTTRLP